MSTPAAEHAPHKLADNVDGAEIDKFSAWADRWWDADGDMAPLHAINPLRTDYITRGQSLDGQRAIDVGCGGGLLSEALARAGAQVTGLDMAQASIEVAKAHAVQSGLDIDYTLTTAEEHAESDAGRYDLVTCLEMLEHVPDPASVVAACAALVKPGGQVVFSTINRNPKAFAFAIVGAEYVLKLLPQGTHDYAAFIKPSELGLWARQAGLVVEDCCGLSYNPLAKTYKLDPDDVSVNYLMRTRRPAE